MIANQEDKWEDIWESKKRGSCTSFPIESFFIGNNRQLFIDNYIIEHIDKNLKKVQHQPVRDINNPVIKY